MRHERIASLDLLRGIAALAVAVCHFIQFHHDSVIAEAVAVLAVEIFFVLSGYVLASQLVNIVAKPSNIGIFWVRRWMRTVPAYLLAILIISAMSHELWTGDFFRYLFYVQNFSHQSNSSDYYTVAWSLSVEEWFYLIFPIFLLAVSALAPGRPMLAALMFITIISVARIKFGDDAHWGDEVRRVVIYRMDAIAWGFVLSLLVTRTKMLRRIGPPTASIAMIMVGAAAIISTVALGILKNDAIELAFPFYAPGFGIAAVLTAIGCEKIVERSFDLTRISRTIGKLSYSIYLFHVPVLVAIAAFSMPLILQFIVWLIATILTAALVFEAIEVPILRSRPNFVL
jgi:peptidoglycan/LPS O-acetylase OafA/YrhL